MPESFSKEAFAASALAIKEYLKSKSVGLGLPDQNVLDLFESDEPVESQDKQLTEFLYRHKHLIESVILYYVGHGGFLNDHQYFLSVKKTDPRRRHFTGLRARDLAETLKVSAVGKKVYLILDCCFAGAAVDNFQSEAISTLVEEQTYENFSFGTALFAASSRNEPAITPDGGKYTMMSEALLSVLGDGIPTKGDFLSLRSVAEETDRRMRCLYGRDAVRPEVHTPRQINEDIADIPIFPNRVPRSARVGADARRIEKYNSDLEAPPFEGWIPWVPGGIPGQGPLGKIGPLVADGRSSYSLEAFTSGPVGTNRNMMTETGLIEFRYKVIKQTGNNIAFYVIPMRHGEQIRPGRRAIGSEIRDIKHTGSDNPLRIALRPKDGMVGVWQTGRIHFDFSRLGLDIFITFAPRINEGQEAAGPGHVVFTRVQFYAFEAQELIDIPG